MGKAKAPNLAQSPAVNYESPKGFHRHKCDNCSHVWEHDDSCKGKTNLHTCPDCKEEEWSQYFGPEPPTKKETN